MKTSEIRAYDSVLPLDLQQSVLEFLLQPGWGYGAYSNPSPSASRYWYKHFAGHAQNVVDENPSAAFEIELMQTAPCISAMWLRLKTTIMANHCLTRCYANAYPYGSEGAVHVDSNRKHDYTAIYFPHLTWHPDFAGETIFFNEELCDIVGVAYPRPNRLVVFNGTMPHVARAVSKVAAILRITLMFKTHLISER